MQEPGLPSRVVSFDVFEIDLRAGELRKEGRRVKLQERPFRVLSLLGERGGGWGTREGFGAQAWPAATFVDFDHGLNSAVARLREALRDSADNPRFIETIAKRGYRLIAPLKVAAPEMSIPSAMPPPNKTPFKGYASGKVWISAAGFLALLCSVGAWASHRQVQEAALASIEVAPLGGMGG